jgi:hypothetical protein
MKLGTQTGSGINHLYSRMTAGAPEPEVGMGATVMLWTDRHAATVVGTYNGGKIVQVQCDKATRIDKNGMSEMQEYVYEPDEDGPVYFFRKNKTGGWDQVLGNTKTGRWNKVHGGVGVIFGFRREYHDFSF